MNALHALASRLWRRRGFLALTVAVLGLGLGSALTVLEIADALFWRPLPYADAEQLVFAWQVDSRTTRLTVTGADFLSWSTEAEPFTAMAAVSARGFNLASDGEPERVDGALVSADFFQLLGTRPLLGRVIDPGPPGPRVAVLSESFWRRRFGADPGVLGRTLSLDDEPVQVIGVMPAAIRLPATAQLWVSARARVPEHPTYPIDPDTDRARHFLTVVARLRPGWSTATA
ncbi:MAG TPA: ABC transporter permease, partial [Myxococcaceae bacterium]|nr:ABC transporter permease [Myxococcaceae bacterium]